MEQVISFFSKYKVSLKSLGVGSFGPIDIQKKSKTYGYITSTPKIAWKNFDFIGELKKYFDIPIYWTTDVNAACYGEYVAGNGVGLSSVVYYTIGTGVGGGALQDGRFIEGFSHPEMGHMRILKHKQDLFGGNCSFHHDCLEGLASGTALEKRTGIKGQELDKSHPAWEIEAFYIAQCAYNTTLLFSPDRIIFGGGVMKQAHLVEKVREIFTDLLQEYVQIPAIDTYIVTPKLGDNAGTIGCLALAKEATS
ncbi:fructokinase [Enterococcus phoeniculicola]|nr:fructokinase [Enterococcus phoeniculicola]